MRPIVVESLKLGPEPTVTLSMRTYCDICGKTGTETVRTIPNPPVTNDRRADRPRREHDSCAANLAAFRAAEKAQRADDSARAFDRFRAERAALVNA